MKQGCCEDDSWHPSFLPYIMYYLSLDIGIRSIVEVNSRDKERGDGAKVLEDRRFVLFLGQISASVFEWR